jgi:hypothetical protein
MLHKSNKQDIMLLIIVGMALEDSNESNLNPLNLVGSRRLFKGSLLGFYYIHKWLWFETCDIT